MPDRAALRLASRWLLLGAAALLVSGLFAVLIVLSRAPYIHRLVPWLDFFHAALVVHVDLSVLVWFAAFAGVLWSIHSTRHGAVLGQVALVLAWAGAGLMAAAPFAGAGEPLMSNYIPVVRNPVFLAGLALFAVGFLMLVARALLFAPPVGPWVSRDGALRFGLNTAAVAAAVALLAFTWSYSGIPGYIGGAEYFELLFWGGGHVLQFVYTHLMLVSWLWLADACGAAPRIGARPVLFLFAWGLAAVFLTPLIYFLYDVGSPEHRHWFTWQMRFGGSLAALPIGIAVVLGLFSARGDVRANGAPERAALVSSLVLFGAGGVLGFLIHGSNVTVPAHYHGSIVGVTLAFMGMTYHLLPRLGFNAPAPRLAAWQAYLYGAGQLLHVAGLAWSGGYGVQRKTAGAAQALDSIERVLSMGLMGVGGLIAVVGGFLFLLVVFRAVKPGIGDRRTRVGGHI